MNRPSIRSLVSVAAGALFLVPFSGCDDSKAVTQTTQSPAEKASVSKYDSEIAKNKAAAAESKKK